MPSIFRAAPGLIGVVRRLRGGVGWIGGGEVRRSVRQGVGCLVDVRMLGEGLEVWCARRRSAGAVRLKKGRPGRLHAPAAIFLDEGCDHRQTRGLRVR
jgi:hypothetical protein